MLSVKVSLHLLMNKKNCDASYFWMIHMSMELHDDWANSTHDREQQPWDFYQHCLNLNNIRNCEVHIQLIYKWIYSARIWWHDVNSSLFIHELLLNIQTKVKHSHLKICKTWGHSITIKTFTVLRGSGAVGFKIPGAETAGSVEPADSGWHWSGPGSPYSYCGRLLSAGPQSSPLSSPWSNYTQKQIWILYYNKTTQYSPRTVTG